MTRVLESFFFCKVDDEIFDFWSIFGGLYLSRYSKLGEGKTSFGQVRPMLSNLPEELASPLDENILGRPLFFLNEQK